MWKPDCLQEKVVSKPMQLSGENKIGPQTRITLFIHPYSNHSRNKFIVYHHRLISGGQLIAHIGVHMVPLTKLTRFWATLLTLRFMRIHPQDCSLNTMHPENHASRKVESGPWSPGATWFQGNSSSPELDSWLHGGDRTLACNPKTQDI